jgi:DNA-binding transcriptional MerR regulator
VTKGPEAFRTISEAASEIGVAQHVLRFWETKFSFIRPMKRAGGRRFYRPHDLLVLSGVRRLLHDEGYTIAGVQKLYREQGSSRLVAAGGGGGGVPSPEPLASARRAEASPGVRAALQQALEALVAAREQLAEALEPPED